MAKRCQAGLGIDCQQTLVKYCECCGLHLCEEHSHPWEWTKCECGGRLKATGQWGNRVRCKCRVCGTVQWLEAA